MKLKSAILACTVTCLSINLNDTLYASSSEFIDLINTEIDNGDYNIISSYDSKRSNINLQFNLGEESIVALELYNPDGKMIKVWNPQVAESGIYKSSISVEEIPDGTYLLNIIINRESFQQAVFKY